MSLFRKFDIYDQSSWIAASNRKFKWGRYTFINDETGKPYTEKELVSFFVNVFAQLDRHGHNYSLVNKHMIINSTLQGYVDRLSESEHPPFDILYPELWGYASDRQLIWDGVPLCNAESGGPLCEKDAVAFFEAIFAFLEHNGSKLPLEKKQQAIRTVLDRAKTTNTKSAIEQKQQEQEREASKGKTKVQIRCNYYREERHFHGTCWKCGYPIPQNFSNLYQCPHCGFITFHDGDKYLDEWEYWGLDEARVICSSAHGFINFLSNNLQEDYDRIEKSCSNLPEFSKINIEFAALIDVLNKSPRIEYQDMRQAYYEYSRFLFEHGAYFYEALYNAQVCNLLYLKEFGAEEVKAVCRMPCQKQCTDFPSCDIDEAIRNPTFPKRDALDTGFLDYDDPEEVISRGYVIGYCHGEYKENITSPLYDVVMAKLSRQSKAWGKAVEQAEKEFNARGIKKPDDETPGYLERINEIYRGFLTLS